MSGDGMTFIATVLIVAGVVGFNYGRSHEQTQLQSLEAKVETLTEENEQLKAERQRTQAQLEGALMIRR